MGSVLIHWRTAVVVSLLALAMFLVEGLEKKAYQKGHAQATAEITTDLKDSALRQMEEARKTEDLSRATFAREQSKIEKERQNAETTIADLRRELVRVQRYTQNLMPDAGNFSRKAQQDMQNWLKPPTGNATTSPSGRPMDAK